VGTSKVPDQSGNIKFVVKQGGGGKSQPVFVQYGLVIIVRVPAEVGDRTEVEARELASQFGEVFHNREGKLEGFCCFAV
jgi:hypothetical protein